MSLRRSLSVSGRRPSVLFPMSPRAFWWGFAGLCAAIVAAGAIFGPVAGGAVPQAFDPSPPIAAAVLLALYFAPTLLAWNYRDPHIGRIFLLNLLNLLIGWTLVGWLIVLVRATLPAPRPAQEPLSER